MICGYSLEANLKPKLRLLGERGFAQAEIARTLAIEPNIVGYSSKRLDHHMDVLGAQGVLNAASLRDAMQLTDAKFAARFE